MAEILNRDELADVAWPEIATDQRIGLVPPGDILRLDFMEPFGLSARALARDISVPANLITGILNGQRSITARTAILLSQRLATSAEFWMNLQTAHDLETARATLEQAAE